MFGFGAKCLLRNSGVCSKQEPHSSGTAPNTDPIFSMPSAHRGTDVTGRLPKFLTNTEFIENAIERTQVSDEFKETKGLRSIREFHLHSIRFTFMLKRNHSVRSGSILATSSQAAGPVRRYLPQGWSDFH